jgi:hypothetical protein
MTAQTDPSQMSPDALAKLGEGIEAHMMEEMVRTMSPDVVARYGVRLERIGGATAMCVSEVNFPWFNRVLGLGLREPVTDAVLNAAQAFYRDARVLYMLPIAPAVLTDELHAKLEARGLRRSDNWAKMIRGVEPPPEIRTDLRLEPVGAHQAEAFAEVLCTCFGLPPECGILVSGLIGEPSWRHYAAFDGDRLVATGALCVRGEAGILGLGATLPSHRERGAQGAIMARRIRDAATLGCRLLITETGEDTPEHPNPSYHNMLRTGFRLAYLRPNYIFFPE